MMAVFEVIFTRLGAEHQRATVVAADEELAPTAAARRLYGADARWDRAASWRSGRITVRARGAAGQGVIDPRAAVSDQLGARVTALPCAWDDCGAPAESLDADGDAVCAACAARRGTAGHP